MFERPRRARDSSNGIGTYESNFLISMNSAKYFADESGLGQITAERRSGYLSNFKYRSDGRIAGAERNSIETMYYYDGLDRIVVKKVKKNGQDFTNSFLSLGTESRVLIGKNGVNEKFIYVDGQGEAERLGVISNGNATTFITDRLGSVLNTSSAGNGRSYGIHGEHSQVQELSETSDPVTFGFAGLVIDLESGLYRTSFRQYDPNIARWTTQEPLGLDGPNFYHYARSNPLRFRDSNGLLSFDEVKGYAGVAKNYLASRFNADVAKTVLLGAGAGVAVVAATTIGLPTLAAVGTGFVIGAGIGTAAGIIGGDTQALANIASSAIIGAAIGRLGVSFYAPQASLAAANAAKLVGALIGAGYGAVLPANANSNLKSGTLLPNCP